MKRNLILWSGYLSFVFLLASCASTAHIEKDDNADFKHYKTFAWVDKDGEGKKDHNKTNDLTEEKIRKAVNLELEKNAGWRESKNHPDVLLSYDVLVERGVKENNNPVYSRPYSRVIFNPNTRRYSTIYYRSEFIGYNRDQRTTREEVLTTIRLDYT